MNATHILSRIVTEAIRIREESYDKEAEAAQQKKDEAERVAEPNNDFAGWGFDYSTLYRKTLQQAAEEACAALNEPALSEIVYYMLRHVWNDASAWAQAQRAVPVPFPTQEVYAFVVSECRNGCTDAASAFRNICRLRPHWVDNADHADGLRGYVLLAFLNTLNFAAIRENSETLYEATNAKG
jgi:hypothetical protein